MSTENIHEATGAYVLDALPEPERAAFEAHLETCPDCTREVRDLAATTTLLAAAAAVEPPPELREAVLRRIRQEPGPGRVRVPPVAEGEAVLRRIREQPGPERRPPVAEGEAVLPRIREQPGPGRVPPVAEPEATLRRIGEAHGPVPTPPVGEREATRKPPVAEGEAVPRRIRQGPGPGRRPPVAEAARHRAPARRAGRARWALTVCVAAAVGFGGVAVWQYQRADAARQEARAAEARAAALTGVLSAPDARLASARIAVGGTGAVVASRERDRAVFVPSGMAAPPPGRTYQLWFADPGGMRPAGLTDPARPDAPTLLAGSLRHATAIGVTVEPETGSPTPTTIPLVLLPLPDPRTP